jgi:uncharacterized protein (DUF4415 family)
MSERNTVKLKLDPNNLGSQTSKQRERLRQIAAMPDAQIDYSDISRSTSDVQWTRPGALVSSENKQQVTLRLDADVLNFFKTTGKRYQSRINAALREYMKAHS